MLWELIHVKIISLNMHGKALYLPQLNLGVNANQNERNLHRLGDK